MSKKRSKQKNQPPDKWMRARPGRPEQSKAADEPKPAPGAEETPPPAPVVVEEAAVKADAAAAPDVTGKAEPAPEITVSAPPACQPQNGSVGEATAAVAEKQPSEEPQDGPVVESAEEKPSLENPQSGEAAEANATIQPSVGEPAAAEEESPPPEDQNGFASESTATAEDAPTSPASAEATAADEPHWASVPPQALSLPPANEEAPIPAPVASANLAQSIEQPVVWKKAQDYFTASAENLAFDAESYAAYEAARITSAGAAPEEISPPSASPAAPALAPPNAGTAPEEVSPPSAAQLPTAGGEKATTPQSIDGDDYHSFEEAAMQFLKSRGVTLEPGLESQTPGVKQEGIAQNVESQSFSGTKQAGISQPGQPPAPLEFEVKRGPDVNIGRESAAQVRKEPRKEPSTPSWNSGYASDSVSAKSDSAQEETKKQEDSDSNWHPVGKIIDPKILPTLPTAEAQPLSKKSAKFIEEMRKSVGNTETKDLPQERKVDDQIPANWNQDDDATEEEIIAATPARPLMPAAPLRKAAMSDSQKLSLEDRLLSENIQAIDPTAHQLQVRRLKDKTTTSNNHVYLAIYAICLLLAFGVHRFASDDVRDITHDSGLSVTQSVNRLMIPNTANKFSNGLGLYEDEDVKALASHPAPISSLQATILHTQCGFDTIGKVLSGQAVAGGVKQKKYWFELPTGFIFGMPTALIYTIKSLWISVANTKTDLDKGLIIAMYLAICALSFIAYKKVKRRLPAYTPTAVVPIIVFILMAMVSVVVWAVLSFSASVWLVMSDTVQLFTALAVILIAIVAMKFSFVAPKKRPRDPRLG
ncbi:MAG TPA: hypothetical protein V6C81_00765 [Planktothrix sp.]|jgi:hypothetical protein